MFTSVALYIPTRNGKVVIMCQQNKLKHNKWDAYKKNKA